MKIKQKNPFPVQSEKDDVFDLKLKYSTEDKVALLTKMLSTAAALFPTTMTLMASGFYCPK